MQHPIQIITTIKKNGSLSIKGLPVRAGEEVAVTIFFKTQKPGPKQNRYPLRGKPIQYHHPFDSVAEKDWESLR